MRGPSYICLTGTLLLACGSSESRAPVAPRLAAPLTTAQPASSPPSEPATCKDLARVAYDAALPQWAAVVAPHPAFAPVQSLVERGANMAGGVLFGAQPLALWSQAVSPDGRHVATWPLYPEDKAEHKARLFDVEAGAERDWPKTFPDAITKVAFGGELALLQLGHYEDATLALVESASGKVLQRHAAKGTVGALAVASTGRYLVEAGGDHQRSSFFLYERTSPAPRATWTVGSGSVASKFSPEGNAIVQVLEDKDPVRVEIRSAPSGKLLKTLTLGKWETGAESALVVGRAARRFATAAYLSKSVTLVEGDSRRTLDVATSVRGLALDESEDKLVIAGTDAVVTVAIADGKTTVRPGGASRIAIAKDGITTEVVSSRTGLVIRRRAKDGEIDDLYDVGFLDGEPRGAFSAEGSLFLAWSPDVARVYALPSGDAVGALHGRGIYGMSARGQEVFVATHEGEARLRVDAGHLVPAGFAAREDASGRHDWFLLAPGLAGRRTALESKRYQEDVGFALLSGSATVHEVEPREGWQAALSEDGEALVARDHTVLVADLCHRGAWRETAIQGFAISPSLHGEATFAPPYALLWGELEPQKGARALAGIVDVEHGQPLRAVAAAFRKTVRISPKRTFLAYHPNTEPKSVVIEDLRSGKLVLRRRDTEVLAFSHDETRVAFHDGTSFAVVSLP